jgi:membrane-bound lytic murein transglycosylase C
MKTLRPEFYLLAVIMVAWLPLASLWAKDSTETISDSKGKYPAYLSEQKAELARFQSLSQSEFDAWRNNNENQFEAFKKKIARQWGTYRGSSNKTWVEYGDNARSRSVVDFKNGIVTVEVLEPKTETRVAIVKKSLRDAVERVVTSPGGTLDGQAVKSSNAPRSALLTNQLSDSSGMPVSPQNAASFANHIVEERPLNKSEVADPAEVSYSLSFPLVPDHLVRRMAPFIPVVRKYCLVYDLDAAEVLAIIHTESYFNPEAYSASHAVGLMQLVPEKGARDAFRFVSNSAEAHIPTSESLFDPETNIHLGCAYLHLLKTRDFGEITNKDCNMYCSIASYNGGPACVANAFTGGNFLPPAIRAINSMSDPSKVYLFLIGNLPAMETRRYLEDVVQRTRLYE